MKKDNVLYNVMVVTMVKNVFGKDSQIYQSMMSGEKISYMIKAEIKKKGKGQSKNIKAKKIVYSKCVECESLLISKNDEQSFGV